MKFPIGGTAREPQGTIRLDSGADSYSLDGRRRADGGRLEKCGRPVIDALVFCTLTLIVMIRVFVLAGVRPVNEHNNKRVKKNDSR